MPCRRFDLSTLAGVAAVGFLMSCGGTDLTEPTTRKDPAGKTQKTSPRPSFATSTNGAGLSITTDKDDYAPGDTVWFTGAGWPANDTLDIVLDDEPATHPPHQWAIPVRADGTFRDSTYVVDEGDIDVAFTLTATSRATGERLAVRFTDGNPNGVAAIVGQAPNPVTAGNQATYTIRVTYGGNASLCTAVLSAAPTVTPAWPAPPSGGFFSFNPSSVTGKGGGGGSGIDPQSILTVTTPAGMAANTYQFRVTVTPNQQPGEVCQGTGATSVPINLVVTAPAAVATSTQIASSQNPSSGGDAVTFTATVTSGSPATPVTTGSVTFREGTCAAGTVLSGPTGPNGSGQAAFTTSTLSLGSHTIRACYGGATGFLASEGSVVQQVQNTATDIDLISSHNPSVTGQPVTFTATVTNNSNPVTTGQLAFKKGGTSCSNATQVQAPATPNASGKVTYSTSFAASESPLTIRACYGGSTTPVLGASEAALAQNVNRAETSTGVTGTPNPSVFSQSVTFEATVTTDAPGVGTAAGNVTLKDGTCAAGAIVGGPTALNGSGKASFSVSTLNAGPHTISACYAGDADFNGSGGSVAQTVNQAKTSTAVTSTANPVVFSQTVTFNVTVDPVAPAVATPVGNVALKNGTCAAGAPLGGPTALVGGAASFDVSTLAVGTHTITACYSGNANFEASDGDVQETVNKAHTSTAVASDANPSVFSQTVSFTVTVAPVAPAVATPTGNVTLKDGTCASGASLGGPTALNASGKASFDVSSLSVGSHTVTGCYPETTNFEASDGNVPQTVNKASTTTAITSSVNPSTLAQPVTFHVTVDPVAPAVATPQGNVSLKDGTCAAGTAISGPTALNAAGEVNFVISTLGVGQHTVTGCYAGNASFEGSDASLTQQVKYNFAGLFDPVDRPNTMNLSKAGQGIPLKWRLTDFNGAPVLNFAPAALGVAVSGLPCDVSATLDQIESYAGNSGLQNMGDGYYQFNWKTPQTYANSCKAIGLDLGEGSVRGPLAFFNFKK